MERYKLVSWYVVKNNEMDLYDHESILVKSCLIRNETTLHQLNLNKIYAKMEKI